MLELPIRETPHVVPLLLIGRRTVLPLFVIGVVNCPPLPHLYRAGDSRRRHCCSSVLLLLLTEYCCCWRRSISWREPRIWFVDKQVAAAAANSNDDAAVATALAAAAGLEGETVRLVVAVAVVVTAELCEQ